MSDEKRKDEVTDELIEVLKKAGAKVVNLGSNADDKGDSLEAKKLIAEIGVLLDPHPEEMLVKLLHNITDVFKPQTSEQAALFAAGFMDSMAFYIAGLMVNHLVRHQKDNELPDDGKGCCEDMLEQLLEKVDLAVRLQLQNVIPQAEENLGITIPNPLPLGENLASDLAVFLNQHESEYGPN